MNSTTTKLKTAQAMRQMAPGERDVSTAADSVMADSRSEYDPRIRTQGSGPPIVLVSGMDGTGELFYRQLPLLLSSYRVTTYALRDDAASIDVLANDLKWVIEQVAPTEGRAIVMGESFGGAVSLTTAVHHPGRISALVILNSFPYFAPQYRLRLAIAGLQMIPWGAMGLVRRLTAFRLHSRHTHRAEMKRFLELTARATRTGYLSRLKILQSYDVREQLHEIRCPTLLLAADQDHLVPSVAQARYMAERIPDATLRVLSGHGHICLIARDLSLCNVLADWHPAI